MPGVVLIDLLGTEISAEERELLQHPLVGGVILFTRNYESPAQLVDLCRAIRQSRKTPLLIAVDQEGGRVQRFREGFVKLPAMGEVGDLYESSPDTAKQYAYITAWLMATELLTVGIDLSFAPVLDINKSLNTAIGNRAFSSNPATVGLLAAEFIRGMHAAGMAATGKHFPGHGSVTIDSHLALPLDQRSYAEIYREDLQPFIQLINANIDAIMPAHILFPAIAEKPAGFSSEWLQDILRKQLKFSGIIFSDDLNMHGADAVGDYATRAQAALEAGCNMILICNNRAGAIEIIDRLPQRYSLPAEKFMRLQGKSSFSDLATLHASTAWQTSFNKFLHYGERYAHHH